MDREQKKMVFAKLNNLLLNDILMSMTA